MRFLSCTSGLY
uniref:Uncharacterized protein n=1 Tax=Lepeophtheirus salmonis TaxID=72036 RepID=A0A0K2SXD9_LEPSM